MLAWKWNKLQMTEACIYPLLFVKWGLVTVWSNSYIYLFILFVFPPQGRGSGFPGRRRPRGAGLSGRAGRGRARGKNGASPSINPGVCAISWMTPWHDLQIFLHVQISICFPSSLRRGWFTISSINVNGTENCKFHISVKVANLLKAGSSIFSGNWLISTWK